ncbi:MAG: c-type cytochrome [Saprospiraceae bacterium]|nr:c-type cytochrome [Saprospiraceae bacterium]
MKRFALAITLVIFTIACHTYRELPKSSESGDWKSIEVPKTPQELNGDAEAGLNYLIYGDYIGSGIPYEMAKKRFGKNQDAVLKRTGENAHIQYNANVFKAANGVEVMNGNCFACHASELNGEIIIGLGNSFSDYTKSMNSFVKTLYFGVNLKYKKDSPEWQAYEDFGNYSRAMAPYIQLNQQGANPAFRLAEACMMHRDPMDLTWREEPNYKIADYPVATDVPPLWNVKKKNGLYYNGGGRGDFTKLLFQASVLGIPDSSAARQAINNFKDVYAWLRSLEPPKYPGNIDQKLAAEGKIIFEEHCSKCHGTYNENWTYPNKVIALDIIKTDPMYAYYANNSGISYWYNNSWFALSEPRSWFDMTQGYIAPPLDGIWATAPYLHNGSVPTLEDLLNSPQRPIYWQRSGNSHDYNYNKVGWKYDIKDKPGGKWTFDTTLPAYSNAGHYFGDKLTKEERTAVIEYLKSL